MGPTAPSALHRIPGFGLYHRKVFSSLYDILVQSSVSRIKTDRSLLTDYIRVFKLSCPLVFSFLPSAARAKILDFIKTGSSTRSAARHEPIPSAQRIPATRTGTNDDNTKTRNAAISIKFASTIGLPVRNIESHIAHPASVDEIPTRSSVAPASVVRSATHCR